MAATEARAAWQRTANRYFVQEDAKRAPKLAYCSSPSSRQQPDASFTDSSNASEPPPSGFMPLNWNPSYSNLSPDTKWWLQLPSNFGCQKDCTHQQANFLEVEVEEKINEEKLLNEDIDNGLTKKFDLDSKYKVSIACMKSDSESKMQELRAINNELQHPFENMVEKIDKVDKDSLDSEIPWIETGKNEKWWHTSDKDELASFVARKSLECFDNCDLPRPQSTRVMKGPFGTFENCNGQEYVPSLDQNKNADLFRSYEWDICGNLDKKHSICNSYEWDISTSSNDDKKINLSRELHCSTYDSEQSCRDSMGSQCKLKHEPSKSELLEALRHSQTRAREAEQAAKEAFIEKEHIVKLFLRQASHLFAYKQWIQILQIETICLQLKNKEHGISTILPVLPWIPSKKKPGNNSKSNSKKSSQPNYDFCKHAVAIAIGLSLAGAGLILGWTIGCLLPVL